YATGPQVQNYNAGQITAATNWLDSLNYYFIHIDASDTPKRVATGSVSANPVTHTVSSFNDVALYENNDYNLIKSGTRWLGDLFDIELTKTFTVALPDVNTASPVNLET